MSESKEEEPSRDDITSMEMLISDLIGIEQELKVNKDTIGKFLRTSFLQSEVLLNTKLKDIGDNPEFNGIIEVIENGKEIITKITRFDSWWTNNDLVLNLIYDILQHLKPDDVLGDPARNFFRIGHTEPGIFLLHCFSRIVYTILSTILLILIFLGKVEGWYAIIIGFTSATFSAIKSENDLVGSISQYLAIFTGIFAAAKGIDLSNNYLYPKFEDLTVEILRLAFGKKYSTQAVYQLLFDWNWYSKFAMALRVKKTDIEMVQYVQTFFAIVKSSNIVNGKNYTEILKLQNVLTRMEGVLQDPYNYLVLYELETRDNIDRLYDFNKSHVTSVKNIYNQIAPNDSFREYIKELNNNPKVIHADLNVGRSAASTKKKKQCFLVCCRKTTDQSDDETNTSKPINDQEISI